MAGLYIHIPFCRQKCHYCNFYSVASQKQQDHFLMALHQEIALQKDYLSGETLQTIYFGGGTPSLLTVKELNNIFDSINKYHSIAADAEITLEANPDDLSREKLTELSKSNINRLSIGIQSFRDEDLRYLHRVHTAAQAIKVIYEALEAGFTNLSIDLIYGIPTLSHEHWLKNLETFRSFGLPHLSAYALTVEPGTPLAVLIKKGKMKPVLDEHAIKQLEMLTEFINQASYEQYEVSNFCRNGMVAIHNTSYWSGAKYLGLGPSAHSYDTHARQWNMANTTKYIAALAKGYLDFEKEALTREQKFNEYVMLSLRTKWGAQTDKLKALGNKKGLDHFKKGIQKYIDNGFVNANETTYTLTPKGITMADGIAANLFL